MFLTRNLTACLLAIEREHNKATQSLDTDKIVDAAFSAAHNNR